MPDSFVRETLTVQRTVWNRQITIESIRPAFADSEKQDRIRRGIEKELYELFSGKNDEEQ